MWVRCVVVLLKRSAGRKENTTRWYTHKTLNHELTKSRPKNMVVVMVKMATRYVENVLDANTTL